MPLASCRRLGLVLAIVWSSAGAARAQDYAATCYGADATEDGRWVVFRPLCLPVAALELATGQLVGAAEATRIAAEHDVVPLASVPPDGRFGAWMTAVGPALDEGSGAVVLAYRLPDSAWIVRARFSGPCLATASRIQVAPRAAFEDAFARHLPAPVEPPAAERPSFGPLGVHAPADLRAVFVRSEADATFAWGTRRRITYDARAFAERVPSFADLARHAHYGFELGSTLGCATPRTPGTAGWRVERPVPAGFWPSLGFDEAGFRLVHRDDHGSANDELASIYDALVAGKVTKLRTFHARAWVVVELTPRRE
ncbi:MAG: hypothetical protein U1F43_09745 [Myxococcota bacterium]